LWAPKLISIVDGVCTNHYLNVIIIGTENINIVKIFQ